MAEYKPSIPKGTRDFSPGEMVKRNYIFDCIKNVFIKYGYLPIETPSMEKLSTLLGKYGDEGDKLIFKILDNGNFLSDVKEEDYTSKELNKLSLAMCGKGLRYDLTVPFARYVVQNRNDIVFPFKRYQIQPVWRADRPQKGRYREFYQCDADVIGSKSLANEVELIQIIDEVFSKLKIDVTIKLNNRKILAGIAEYIGAQDKIVDITVAVDKIEKIGLDSVLDELEANGIKSEARKKLLPVLKLKGDQANIIGELNKILADSEVGKIGIEELEKAFNYINTLKILNSKIEFDLTLARGLNYYTGAIIEVKANDVEIGSICGGGRYDDLTGIFGLPDVSGVGISFGADRIYDVMTQLELYPSETQNSTQILFVNFGEEEYKYCLKLVSELRNREINTEIYPDAVKMKKQMSYANQKGIRYVALVGKNEIEKNEIALKDMISGEQESIDIDKLMKKLIDG